jgi:hypothetical protein
VLPVVTILSLTTFVAQDAVQGTNDEVATEFCLVPIKDTTLELFQNEADKAQLAVIGYREPVTNHCDTSEGAQEALIAQLDVIGNVEPVDIVPGAASANKELLAHDALTAFNELVAQIDCVAQIAVLGTKLIAVAIVAQLAVQGTVEPLATEFCLVPIRETIELLFQNDAV